MLLWQGICRGFAYISNTVANSSQDFSANPAQKFCHRRKNSAAEGKPQNVDKNV